MIQVVRQNERSEDYTNLRTPVEVSQLVVEKLLTSRHVTNSVDSVLQFQFKLLCGRFSFTFTAVSKLKKSVSQLCHKNRLCSRKIMKKKEKTKSIATHFILNLPNLWKTSDGFFI